MPARLLELGRTLLLALFMAGALTIAAGTPVYFDGEELAPFVIEKLPVPLESLYLFALKTHVVAAAFSLPACIVLSTRFLTRFPRVHRWLGRVSGAVILLALVPSGLYLAIFAKGGVLSTLGFALSGAIVAVGMVAAIRLARERRFAEHRRCTLHVLGQLSVAVTSRAMLFAFDALGVEHERAYLVSLWLPVLASAAAVELLTHRLRITDLPWRNHETLPRSRPAQRRHDRLGGAAGA